MNRSDVLKCRSCEAVTEKPKKVQMDWVDCLRPFFPQDDESDSDAEEEQQNTVSQFHFAHSVAFCPLVLMLLISIIAEEQK